MKPRREIYGVMGEFHSSEELIEAVHKLRLVQPDSQMVQTARAVEISFGD